MAEAGSSKGNVGKSRRNVSIDGWRDQVVRLLEFRLQLLLVLCCISWGLTLGIVFWRPPPAGLRQSPHGLSNSTLESLQSVAVDSTDARRGTVPATTRQLHLIDVMLTHGNVAQAMDAYARLEPEVGTALHDQLTYRIAVARETLQQIEQAADSYQQLALQTKEPQMALAARLGQVRIWLRHGRSDLARPVVARSSLELETVTASERIQGELAHLFGLTLLPDQPATNDPYLDDDRIAVSQPRWSPTELLELAEPTQHSPQGAAGDAANSADPDIAGPADTRVLFRYGDNPAEIQLQIQEPPRPAKQLIDALAEVAKLKLSWSRAAEAALTGRSLQLAHPSIAAAVALDQLLLTFELCWFVESDVVLVRSWSEITEAQKSQFLRASSARQLRHAITTHPDHPLAQFSYLALGNLEFNDGAFTNAVSVYDQFQNQFPASVDVIFAQFNTAKALLQLQRRGEALEKFLMVADGAHGHPLQSPANAYGGRMQLEQGAIVEAIRPLMRAVSTAPHSARRVVPALTLASAYLLADNAHAATQVLMEERHNMVRQHDIALADFLGSYARFRAAQNDFDLLQSGRSLIRSLGNLEIETCFGTHIYLLAGDALRDTGFTPQMAELYQTALQNQLPSWVRREAQMRLVSYFRENGNNPLARELLQQIIDEAQHGDGAPFDFRHDAMEQLARLELQEERPEACLALCRDLVQEQPAADILHKVLKLMGRAYQHQGDHYNAALCFAGMLPHAGQAGAAELEHALETKGR